ncbi:MAG: 1,6-anhydro-N-acetylmuramyl-L-alanine amidase AmpD [Gammaproteobacteria bacterium]|nr:1,6-anhydro-N-acetylmuramyl-L-alanine amidase AmpD [Gammaproteobacteria bacterium]
MIKEFIVNSETGLIKPAKLYLSPNRDSRPDNSIVELVLLHGISLPPGQFGGPGVEALFLNKLDCNAHPYFEGIHGMRVSAHLFIRRDGELLQFVPFNERAWHAGESYFRGRSRCNDFSIGIELEGEDKINYDDRQYNILSEVLMALMKAYPQLTMREFVGHSDVASSRKSDPGPAFDWLNLYNRINRLKENKI